LKSRAHYRIVAYDREDDYVMRRLIAAAVSAAVVLVGPAAGGSVALAAGSQGSEVAAGVISSEGHVLRGVGFRVSHPATGSYTITFDRGYLGSECANMVVTPTRGQFALASINTVVCQPSAIFAVSFEDLTGTPIDTAFNFVAVETAVR
jgi:hypothetical protein